MSQSLTIVSFVYDFQRLKFCLFILHSLILITYESNFRVFTCDLKENNHGDL